MRHRPPIGHFLFALAQGHQIPHDQWKRLLFLRLQRAEYRFGVLGERAFQFP